MTIAGVHTAHELRNLWDAYSFEVQAMNRALASAWNAWSAKDPSGFQSFNATWAAFSQAFSPFGEVVDRILATTANGGDEDETPALDPLNLTQGDQFNRLVALFQTGSADGDPNAAWTPQSFNGLDAAFRAGPAASMAPTYEGIPQPDAPDLDLDAYKLTDQAVKVIQKVGAAVTFGILPAVAVAGVLFLFLTRRR